MAQAPDTTPAKLDRRDLRCLIGEPAPNARAEERYHADEQNGDQGYQEPVLGNGDPFIGSDEFATEYANTMHVHLLPTCLRNALSKMASAPRPRQGVSLGLDSAGGVLMHPGSQGHEACDCDLNIGPACELITTCSTI